MKPVTLAGIALATVVLAIVGVEMMPVPVLEYLEHTSSKVLLIGSVILLAGNLAFAVYKHFHAPEKRVALWRIVNFLRFLIGASLVAPPGWAILKKCKFKGHPGQWFLDIQMADIQPPWTSVAVAGIFAGAMIVVLHMFVREHDPV